MSAEVQAEVGLLVKESGKALPLRSLAVEGDINGYVVGLSIKLIYDNDNTGPVEVTFRMPLEEKYVLTDLTALIDGRRIKADVREKEEAKVVYDDAIASGLPAALGEELSKDIFSVSLGNLPGGSKAEIELSLDWQLPIDAEGKLSFTLPAVLKPRYTPATSQGIGATPAPPSEASVDGQAGVSQFLLRVHNATSIASVTSATHSISVEEQADADIKVVTLSEEHALILKTDLVIQIGLIEPHSPIAVVEKGKGSDGTFKSDHLLMINFMPQFPALSDSTQCEFVFLVDRSGSMSGRYIKSASETLVLFLKSLPEGCYFNIYGFGSRYVSLFSTSVPYNQKNLEKAIDHAQSLKADLGGTEILPPLRDIYKKDPIKDFTRQIFLLTDGSVSNTTECIDEVKRNVNIAKCFTFGIGSGASSALVEGMASAGDGTAEFVKEGERLQPKVIRSLKHALQPLLSNVKVSFKFSASDDVNVKQVPKTLPRIFEGERITIYGIVKSSDITGPLEGEVTLGGQIITSEEPINVTHTVSFKERPSDHSVSTIHHLAAKTWILELEKEKQPKEDIIKLSIESNVISSETAFIAVDEEFSTPINEPLTRVSISALKDQLAGVMNLCSASIDNVLTRGDKLDCLEDQSESLATNSAMFMTKAKKKGGFGGGFLSSIGSALSSVAGGFSRRSNTTPVFDGATSSRSAPEPQLRVIDDLLGQEEDSACMSFAPDSKIPSTNVDSLSSLILLQQANGSWVLNEKLASLLQLSLTDVKDKCPSDCPSGEVWATVLVVTALRSHYSTQSDEWELVVKKAENWLKGQAQDSIGTLFTEAKNLIG